MLVLGSGNTAPAGGSDVYCAYRAGLDRDGDGIAWGT